MIAVDASALLAILLDEPEGEAFAECIALAGGGVISAVNLWEVLVRAQSVETRLARPQVEAILTDLNIAVVAASAAHARAAADAFARYGRRTPADLNLGDCFAYALAAEEGDGLLFKGNDFPKTDIKAALA
ncbi:MAG: type II toxin-antitoxin system VapC family toxin [Ignavibacteriales bacterium]